MQGKSNSLLLRRSGKLFCRKRFDSCIYSSPPQAPPPSKKGGGGNRSNSRMPIFNDAEREELQRILDGEDSLDNSFENIQFSDDDERYDNSRAPKVSSPVPAKGNNKQSPPRVSQSLKPTMKPPIVANTPIKQTSKTVAPNSEWRSALSNPEKRTKSSFESDLFEVDRNRRDFKRPPVQIQPEDDFSFTDLDYDDFEQAMREEDNAGLGNMDGYFGGGQYVGKTSRDPRFTRPVADEDEEEEEEEEEEVGEVEKVLMAGDNLFLQDGSPTNILLTHPDGRVSPLTSLFSPNPTNPNPTNPIPINPIPINPRDVIIVYADPRRMTEEFKTVLKELNALPASVRILKKADTGGNVLGVLAVNCDASGDLKKLLKKSPSLLGGGAVTLLADPAKKLMDVTKSRSSSRLRASLLLAEAASGKVLKVWYEPAWDPFTTKDLLVEELALYRKNPRFYLQSQVGIR